MASDIIIEKVPPFVKRPSDLVYEGSNNTIIILGTDRAKDGEATRNDGLLESGTGTIHMIAGRKSNNPSFKDDASFLYVTMKSNIDNNLALQKVEKAQNGVPGIVAKSDVIRIVGRKDIKISTADGGTYIFVDGKKVTVKMGSHTVELDGDKLSADIGQSKIQVHKNGNINFKNSSSTIMMNPSKIVASGPLFKIGGPAGQQWRALINNLLSLITTHVHMSAVGPTLPAGTPVPPAAASVTLGPAVVGLPPNTPLFTAVNSLLKVLDGQCFE